MKSFHIWQKNPNKQKQKYTQKNLTKKKKEELVEGEENVLLCELSLQVPHSILLILKEMEKEKVSRKNLERVKNFKGEC